MAQPTSTGLVPVPGKVGCFKFDVPLMLSLPVMDWKQLFEMGRQAVTGEWKPEPDVPQVRASLPGPDLMPLTTIPEIENLIGSQLAAVPDMTGAAIETTEPPAADPAGPKEDAAEYTSLWVRMSVGLAQDILDNGVWDGLPITQIQRQVAYDFIMQNAPGHRQAQLEEV